MQIYQKILNNKFEFPRDGVATVAEQEILEARERVLARREG